VSVRTAVFASGGGSNLQALLDRFAAGGPASICLVVSDRAEAGALDRARAAGVPTVHVPVRHRTDGDVARDLTAALKEHDIEFIALAGYLRLVPTRVIGAFRDRIVNIHPALLPSFGGRGMYGRHVHSAVIARGCRVSGVTVHWVDENYDEGRIIAQWPVPVVAGDTAESLAARVLQVEHRVYPAAIAAIARGVLDRSHASARATSISADIFRLTPSNEGLDAEIVALAGL
jgi:phosphoribosylglycinamide formyltransferase 1